MFNKTNIYLNYARPQPLDALVRSSSLYFKMVPIPPEYMEIADKLKFISPGGKLISQYVLWLVQTCQVWRFQKRNNNTKLFITENKQELQDEFYPFNSRIERKKIMLQKIRDITGRSHRETTMWGALLMWPFWFDVLLKVQYWNSAVQY